MTLDVMASARGVSVPRLLRQLVTEDRQLHGEELVRVCACGRGYSLEEWLELPAPRLWGDDGEVIELRDCACGSSIAVTLLEHVSCA